MDAPLKKVKLIKGAKAVDKNGKSKKSTKQTKEIRTEYEWDKLKNLSVSDFFKKNTKKPNRNNTKKDIETMDTLLKKNKNMKALDFSVKPKRFKELYTRTIEAPRMMKQFADKNFFNAHYDDGYQLGNEGHQMGGQVNDFGDGDYNGDGGFYAGDGYDGELIIDD